VSEPKDRPAAGSTAVLERLRAADGFIFDMDGTLALGDLVNHGLRPLPGAVEMLAWARSRELPYVVFSRTWHGGRGVRRLVPRGHDGPSGGGLPLNGLTVATALDMLTLPPGSTLAVTGSAGIVGQYAIQLGRHAGLTVIGDAAPADVTLVESFGAHHVVERGDGMAAAVRALYPDDVDAVIDAALLDPAVIGAVRDGGQLLAVRPYQGEPERDITIHLVLVGNHLHEGHRIAELADLVTKGVLTLRIAEVLPTSRAAEAHRRLEAGGVRGRLVLTF